MEVKQKTIVSEETKILICVKATKQRPKHKTYNERKYWGGGGGWRREIRESESL